VLSITHLPIQRSQVFKNNVLVLYQTRLYRPRMSKDAFALSDVRSVGQARALCGFQAHGSRAGLAERQRFGRLSIRGGYPRTCRDLRPREGVVRNFRWQVYSRTADRKAAQYGECEGWLKPPQGLFALYLRLDLVLLAGAGIGSFCCGGAASSTGVLSSGPSIGAALRVPASGSLSS
jgi:hypothetical protein